LLLNDLLSHTFANTVAIHLIDCVFTLFFARFQSLLFPLR